MQRLGPDLFQMRDICGYDILYSRLKLLIFMVKAYLAGHAFGPWGLRSMIRNTRYIVASMSGWHETLANFTFDRAPQARLQLDHIFLQRVRLLTIMVRSFADGNPMGIQRKTALRNNVEYIGDVLSRTRCVQRTKLYVVK